MVVNLYYAEATATTAQSVVETPCTDRLGQSSDAKVYTVPLHPVMLHAVGQVHG